MFEWTRALLFIVMWFGAFHRLALVGGASDSVRSLAYLTTSATDDTLLFLLKLSFQIELTSFSKCLLVVFF